MRYKNIRSYNPGRRHVLACQTSESNRVNRIGGADNLANIINFTTNRNYFIRNNRRVRYDIIIISYTYRYNTRLPGNIVTHIPILLPCLPGSNGTSTTMWSTPLPTGNGARKSIRKFSYHPLVSRNPELNLPKVGRDECRTAARESVINVSNCSGASYILQYINTSINT